MKTRDFILLSLVLVLSILVIVLLQVFSNKVNHGSNAFIRLFPPHKIRLKKALDIKYNSYYVAGMSSRYVYLGNFTAPGNLLITDYNFIDTQYVKLTFPDNGRHLTSSFKVKIDSPHIYVLDGLKPTILHASTGTLSATPYATDSTYFIESAPISSKSFVMRSFDATMHQNVLLKLNYDSLDLKRSPVSLEKQIDGFFCTDGILNYDIATSRLVYTYYYRNQFLCLDTNLSLLYRGRTIDTTRHAKIKVSIIDSGFSTLAAPPLTVNKRSAVSNGLLFVYSLLRSNNETKKAFDSYSVIDVYDIVDGRYKYSLYLNHLNKQKLSSFYVRNQTLVALHDHYLAIYDLQFEK